MNYSKTTLLLVFTSILISDSWCMIPEPHIGPVRPYLVPEYRLDLNVEPYHRWDNIVILYKELINELIDTVFAEKDISEETYNDLNEYFTNIYKYQEMVEEVKGIANVIGARWE